MSGSQTAKRIGPPRIFVEVIREIDGGGVLQSRKEIGLAEFKQARLSMGDTIINECLEEVNLG
jgi:hypothetical protein